MFRKIIDSRLILVVVLIVVFLNFSSKVSGADEIPQVEENVALPDETLKEGDIADLRFRLRHADMELMSIKTGEILHLDTYATGIENLKKIIKKSKANSDAVGRLRVMEFRLSFMVADFNQRTEMYLRNADILEKNIETLEDIVLSGGQSIPLSLMEEIDGFRKVYHDFKEKR